MGRPRTSWQLERLATIAKAREDARKAAQAAATPKPYQKRPVGGSAYFRSIEDNDVFVLMPIPAKATLVVTDPGTAGGVALGAIPTTASAVSFKGNHEQILRVRISLRKATPTVKNTAWGTRVVDHFEESFSFPFSSNGDGSIEATKAAFTTAMNGSLAALLGTRAGSMAELMYGKRVIAKIVLQGT